MLLVGRMLLLRMLTGAGSVSLADLAPPFSSCLPGLNPATVSISISKADGPAAPAGERKCLDRSLTSCGIVGCGLRGDTSYSTPSLSSSQPALQQMLKDA